MRTELLDYVLPPSQIARHPPESRDGGRLLVVGRAGNDHRSIREFARLLEPPSLLVVNDTRVRRARVFGRRQRGGGRVEFLLLEQHAPGDDGRERWLALGRANKRVAVGTVVEADELEIEVLDKDAAGGALELAIRSAQPVEEVLERVGHMPIPPYLKRLDEPADCVRYQTVYARRTASVAAPTAGLHLTSSVLEELSARGVEVARLELEVGLGTFRPVTAEDLDQHPMHEERFRIDSELSQQVRAMRARGGKVIAVGTTVVRALESAAARERPGEVEAVTGKTRLLIQPGYRFQVVDSLLTNFHQPKSTLLALVAAFVGYEPTMAAYREALAAGYRFLSYGDAMWIPERAE